MTAPFVLEHCPATAQFADLRYRFYPCGYLPQDLNSLVYVSYKASNKICWTDQVRLAAGGHEWSLFECPDRWLLFTKSNLTLSGDRPFNRITRGITWHTAIALCPILSAGDDLAYDRFMLNPDGYSAATLPRARGDNVYRTNKVIISDSGGFQLGTGKINWIHPGELADTFNENADEGVTLDIPPRGSRAEPAIIKHTARIQRLNTRYMLPRLKPGFRLANTVHGGYLSHVDMYRREVEADDHPFDICCVAGSLSFNMLEATHRMLHIMNTGQQYAQYHILGIGSPQMMAVMALVAALYKAAGRDMLITSDSSTPINMMIENNFYAQAMYNHEQARWATIPASRINTLNGFKRFSSSDPVAAALGGYQDIKLIYSNAFVRTYLTYINQLEFYRYGAMMYRYAEAWSFREYKALVLAQLHTASKAHLLAQTLDYVDYAFQFGLDRAFERFRMHMPVLTGSQTFSKFHTLLEAENGDHHVDETSTAVDRRTEIVKSTIRGYYDFHKRGTIPQVVRYTPGKERF